MEHSTTGLYRNIRLILGGVITVGIMYWLATTLDFQQVRRSLQEVDYIWIGLGVLTVLITLWARVLRWQALLDSKQITYTGTLQALVLGQLLNLIFPARLGDLGRAYLITQDGYNSQAKALGTMAVEKLWDIILLVVLVMLLSLWYPLPLWIMLPARLTASLGAVLGLGMIGLLIIRPYVALKWREQGQNRSSQKIFGLERSLWSKVAQFTGKLLDGLEGLHRPAIMFNAGGWSVVAWFFGALTNLALLKAFDLPFSFGIALFLLVVLQLGVAVPSVPGRIGVFEGLCLVTLALFRIEGNVALGYGVMLHAVVLVPPLLLGVWLLLRLDISARQTILAQASVKSLP